MGGNAQLTGSDVVRTVQDWHTLGTLCSACGLPSRYCDNGQATGERVSDRCGLA